MVTTIEEGFCLPHVDKFEKLINEAHKGYSDLQSKQSYRLPLYAEGDELDLRLRKEV